MHDHHSLWLTEYDGGVSVNGHINDTMPYNEWNDDTPPTDLEAWCDYAVSNGYISRDALNGAILSVTGVNGLIIRWSTQCPS